MDSDFALKVLGELLWTAVVICAPILIATLVAGLAVSVLQVVTQIQDMSLTFVPKLIATVVALLVFGPWMLRKLISFATTLISNIPNYF